MVDDMIQPIIMKRLRVDLRTVDLFRETITLLLPSTADIKKAMVVGDFLCFYAEIDSRDITEYYRRIRVIKTGEQIPDPNSSYYIDTVIAQRTEVHLYQELNPSTEVKK